MPSFFFVFFLLSSFVLKLSYELNLRNKQFVDQQLELLRKCKRKNKEKSATTIYVIFFLISVLQMTYTSQILFQKRKIHTWNHPNETKSGANKFSRTNFI